MRTDRHLLLLALAPVSLGCGQAIVGLQTSSWDRVIVPDIATVLGAQLLDARSPEEYAASHIPGASNVYWEEVNDFDDTGLWDAGAPEQTAALLGQRGITSDRPVIIYGNGPDGWGDDGDIYWSLRYLGHDEIYVLDGGWATWLAQGGEVSDLPDAPAPTTYQAEVRPEVYASSEQVEAWDGIILDVRSPEEWDAGHIPGAVWMQWSEVYQAATIKDPDAVGALFAELQIDEDTPVVTYCAAGIRAGHTFMMLEAIGIQDARNYVGSWARWSAEGRAVE